MQALVTVHEEEETNGSPSFWEGLSPSVWNDELPQLQTSVHVVSLSQPTRTGFPTATRDPMHLPFSDHWHGPGTDRSHVAG